MVSTLREVQCETCGTRNRLPSYTLRHVPLCGKCRAKLPEIRPVRALRALKRIPIAWWVGAACFGVIGWYSLNQESGGIKRSAARAPEASQCVAQEAITIAGIMRVYDTRDQPPLTKWTINAGPGADYFIKLIDARTEQPKVGYFVHGDSAITTDIPVGSFIVKHASGTTWCGERHFFGPNTVFQKGSKIVLIEPEYRYTLYLTPQRNGNFPTSMIARDQF
jgi:hypothetical protein